MFAIVPPKKMVIMQGVPGSGKSTMARVICDDFLKQQPPGHHWIGVILSTDDYWMENGVYRYDPAKAVEAHRWNQRRCIREMQTKTNMIVIDNTNIQKWQAQIYFNLADMFGYEKSVVSVQVPLDVAIARNGQRSFDRRVPEETIRKMYGDLEPLL